MECMGYPIGADEDLSWIIGPSLRSTFARLLGNRGDPEVAVRHYRERYKEWGLTAATPYLGVREVLAARRAGGTRLFLCTAKPAVFAKRVVDVFDFADLLDGVYGPELDGRLDDKGDLIAHLMAEERLAKDELCMVGDREQDVRAARRNGVPTVGRLVGLWRPGRAHPPPAPRSSSPRRGSFSNSGQRIVDRTQVKSKNARRIRESSSWGNS